MVVLTSPDAYDKLRLLGGMAGDDVLAPEAGRRFNVSRRAYAQPRHRTPQRAFTKPSCPAARPYR